MLERGIPQSIVHSEIVECRWLDSLAKTGWDTLKKMGAHRNKLLLRLDAALGSWGIVMTDSRLVDRQYRFNMGMEDDPKQLWCCMWALQITSLLMDLHMVLLVEMELLSVSELDYFYWYWDYICTSRVHSLETLRQLRYQFDLIIYDAKVEEIKANERKKQSEGVGASGNKKKSSSKAVRGKGGQSNLSADSPAPALPVAPAPPDASAEELLYRGRGQQCRGLFRMLTAAVELEVIDKTECRYTSWSFRFDQRFRAFQSIPNPPLLHYSDYAAVVLNGRDGTKGVGFTDEKLDVQKIVYWAGLTFTEARKLLDSARKCNPSKNDVANTFAVEIAASSLRSTVACGVGSASVGSLLKTIGSTNKSFIDTLRISFDRSSSSIFPVVVISQKKT